MADSAEENFEMERANYRRSPVSVLPLDAHIVANGLQVTMRELPEIKSVKEMSHENVARFVGILMGKYTPPGSTSTIGDVVVWEAIGKGALSHLVDTESFRLAPDFKVSLLSDIVTVSLDTCAFRKFSQPLSRESTRRVGI